MNNLNSLATSSNILFMFIGAVMIFAMHAGFAFLEVGSVRKKNQANALVKIITDWSVSTLAYFVIGFPISYGISFLRPANKIASMGLLGSASVPGFDLMHFFFLLTFAAAIPAIISGGIAERAKFWPQLIAGGILAGIVYPLFESMVWGQNRWFQNIITYLGGAPFHDYAGSVVVHSIGGWLALPAIMILGPRLGRYSKGTCSHPCKQHTRAWPGQLDTGYRLVRLQCNECTELSKHFLPGCNQLTFCHGWRCNTCSCHFQK